MAKLSGSYKSNPSKLALWLALPLLLELIGVFSASQYTSSVNAACDQNSVYWLLLAWITVVCGLLFAFTTFYRSLQAKRGTIAVVLSGLAVLASVVLAGISLITIFFGCPAPF